MDLLNKHEDQLGRGLTYDLWKNFPVNEIFVNKDSNVGVGVMLDPANPPRGPASSSSINAAGGSIVFTDSAEYVRGLLETEYNGGGMRLFATTDNQAAEVQFCGGGEPFIISDTAADAKELIFECAFRVSVVTITKAGFFIGLMEAGAIGGDIIADAGTIADKDCIGFFKPEGAATVGPHLDIIYQKESGGAIDHEADWKTLVAATWYHVGMRYNPNTKKLDIYWGTGDRTTKMAKDDNPILSTDIDDATFPDGEGLCPTIAIKNAHADDFSLDIRMLACAQMAYPAD